MSIAVTDALPTRRPCSRALFFAPALRNAMSSSTMKMARAPRRRASAMSSMTRGIGKRWKFRPRISMIEQKLQSNVQPREVSTTSIWRPSIVYPQSTRAQQLAKRQLSLAADDRVDAKGGIRPGVGREARVVPADDDERLGTHRTDEPDQPACRRALKSHDREPDHVGCAIPHELLDRLPNG